MRTTRGRLEFSAAVLAMALASCPALFAQDYEIRLHRPDAVGSRSHLSAVGKESTSELAKQGDKVLQEQKTKYVVEAELMLTVLAVNEKGKNTRVKIEVEKLTRIEGDARKELAPKGSVITGSWDGKDQAFDMAGGGLEPDTEESLKLLELLTDDPIGPTDDEVFGAKDRKKVGDRWDGNTELMAKDLARFGILMKKEDLTSTVALEKVATLGKTECLQLSCVLACDKFDPPLPPGFVVEKSSMKINFTGKYPVAASQNLPEESSSDLTMTLTAKAKSDPAADEVVLQIARERSLVSRATEVK
jgi:hypothetical protein